MDVWCCLAINDGNIWGMVFLAWQTKIVLCLWAYCGVKAWKVGRRILPRGACTSIVIEKFDWQQLVQDLQLILVPLPMGDKEKYVAPNISFFNKTWHMCQGTVYLCLYI